jgi:uncharacterized protein
LAERLSAAGHTVITLSRSPGRSQPAKEPWGKVAWDGRKLGSWVDALEGTQVLINLANRSVNCRYNAKHRDEIMRSRVESTVVLGEAIQTPRYPPAIWLNASTATIYRHALDGDMDETTGQLGGSEPDAPATRRFSIGPRSHWEATRE